MEIKIGADPEFFLRRNGELVSAHGMVPGTKEEPHAVPGGAIQVDGMALEFNINPATSCGEFSENIQTVLRSFREYLPENEGWEFDFSPVAEFGKELIDAQPYEARILGCEPDFNAWTGQPNPKPNADMPFRTASGHVHIGWTEDEDPYDPEHTEACQMLTKQLDFYLYPVFKFLDLDTKRRELYGQLSSYRPKKYGVEYRVLSNHWLTSPELMELVFDLSKEATTQLLDGYAKYRDYGNPSFLSDNSSYSLRDVKSAAYYSLRSGDLHLKYHVSNIDRAIEAGFEKLYADQMKVEKAKKKDMPGLDALWAPVEVIRPRGQVVGDIRNAVLDIDFEEEI